MKIERERLMDIISKILEELDNEKEKKEYYIVFSSPWNNLYYLALEELENLEIKVNILISCELKTDYQELIKSKVKHKEFILFNDESEIDYKNGKTIFLKLTRNDVIDIVNLYAKNFETRLIKDLLSKGLEINYWDKGLEKITGKEPILYQKKLLKYYYELTEFGIFPIELKAVKK